MKKNIVLGLITGAFIILIIAQLLNFILGISSFEKTFTDSLVSKYRIVSNEVKRQIERSVNFGKPIYRLSGTDTVFSKILSQDSNIKNIFITLPSGKVLYSTNANVVEKNIPIKTIPQFKEDNIYDTKTILEKESYFIGLPVFYNKKDIVGAIYLEFDKNIITSKVNAMINDNLRYVIFTLIGSFLLLVLLFFTINKIEKNLKNKKRPIFVIIFIIFIISLLSYSFFTNKYFEKTFLTVFDSNIETLSDVIKKEIENVLDMGLSIKKLKRVEVLLNEKLRNNPECQEIAITDMIGNVLYKVNNNIVYSMLEKDASVTLSESEVKIGLVEKPYQKLLPIYKKGNQVGFISLLINQKLINDKIFDLLLDTITIIVVSLVFSFELLGFLYLFLSNQNKQGEILPQEEIDTQNLTNIRFTAFIFFFAALFPVSFLPMFIKDLYEINAFNLFNMSKETILSIPISSYLIGITIFIPIVGFLAHKFSIKTIFIFSGALYLIGTIISVISNDIFILTIARFIAGLGYGGCITNSTSLIVQTTSSNTRTTGFGNWSAGFASATICAISIGGVVANRLGFRVAMFITAIFAVLFLLFVYFNIKTVLPEIHKKLQVKFNIKDLVYIFKNRSLLANLFFSSIPYQLSFVGLFQYILPLYMNNEGVSQANIGRLLTLYGALSLFTPLVSRLSDKYKNERLFIIIGNLISGIFLLFFLVSDGIIIFVIVIIGIGIGTTIIDAVEESYLTSSKQARDIGEAKFLSIYTTYEKLVSIIVPLMAGILITGFGYSKSVIIIGVLTLVCVVFFSLLSKNTRVEE